MSVKHETHEYECAGCNATFTGYLEDGCVYSSCENEGRPEQFHASGCPACGCEDIREVDEEPSDEQEQPTLFNEVLITPSYSGFGEYEVSEANGEGWADIDDLEAALRSAVNLIDWVDIENTDLDISGRIHGESCLVRKYCWREADGDIHYCGIC